MTCFYQKQSGFRPNHSCYTAVTELIDTWLSQTNINKLCGALFMDLVKAFDVINHDLAFFFLMTCFYQKQSGFRPNHSCYTAVTELVDTWLSQTNVNKLCGALFMDLVKAFDVINHDLLLRKLTLYGLSANTLSLICSFLNSRLQKVSLKDKQSDFKQFYLEFPKDLC